MKINFIKKNKQYEGWELHNFDNAINFRKYQFRLLNKYISGNVAEIGPGNGSLLEKYMKISSKIDLFEPSKKIFLNLKKKFSNKKKVKVINSKFKEKKNFYDCIIYLDVIEHIKNDKLEILKALNSLKKNGFLLINVPAFQFLYSQFDKDVGHFRRYNKKDFLKLLSKMKYSTVKMIYYDSLGLILYFISKIFLGSNYKKKFSNKVKLWDKLIPISFLIDILILSYFGKSLMVIIKK
jgi:phospholipid N-methyltransferase